MLRFIDSACDTREEFLEFFNTDRITGEVLASKIKNHLNGVLIFNVVEARAMMEQQICQLSMVFKGF